MSALAACLPAAGEEQSEFIEPKQHLLRHGSSLALMALVSEALNSSDEFGDVDPENDWKQWAERGPKFSLYYAALVDPTRDGAEAVSAVLRAIEDPATPERPSGRHRLVIDYVTTRPARRGQGLASTLVRFVSEACAAAAASCYVLALEDSCVYWMDRGFQLETSRRMQTRINIFSDTFLLTHSRNPYDDGEPGDEGLAFEDPDPYASSEESEDDGLWQGQPRPDWHFAEQGERLAKAVSLLEAAGGTFESRENARAVIIRAGRNLERGPLDPKYRRLRKANKVIAPVLAVKGAMECFAELGFVDKGDHLLVEPRDYIGIVERAREVIEALGGGGAIDWRDPTQTPGKAPPPPPPWPPQKS
mmetsp:Transcript_6182/g.18279  ORF Transcript_6182/g.18279 Transcript_6182/m.18279 type:complete len:361 (-) Transcript_6182:80-1162(-)